MADTIVTNSPAANDGGAAAGWIVALVIALAVIVGGFVLYRNGAFGAAAPAPAGSTNVNVTIPNPTTPATPAPTAGGTTKY
jgi:hypothetical protein